jgi:hypothetical protein
MRMHRFFENYVIQIVEPPKASADAVLPSTWIDISQYERFAFLRVVGATDDTAITMQVKQGTSSTGTGTKDVTGAAIVGTDLAGSNDNKWAGVEVECRKLDLDGNFHYVAVDIAATGGSASESTVLFVGINKTAPTGYPLSQGTDCAAVVYVDG